MADAFNKVINFLDALQQKTFQGHLDFMDKKIYSWVETLDFKLVCLF